MKRNPFVFGLLSVSLFTGACHREAHLNGPLRHYPLSGKVISVDKTHRTAMVDAAAIPNFMEAMTMEYPVESKDELSLLKPGDRITATVNVDSDDRYNLSAIKVQPAQGIAK